MNRRLLSCLVVSLALVAAACGGDDGGGGGGGEGARGRDAEVDPSLCPVDALEQSEGPVEIDFWHTMTASNEETLEELVADYNASQDQVEVNAVFKGSYTENLDAYLAGLRADELPNVVQLEETVLQTMIDSGSTVPAAACVEASGMDISDFLPRVIGQFTVEDVLWPMPFNVSNPVFYYDRLDFEAAGLDPDTPPATLDEVEDAAQAIVEAGAAEAGMSIEVQGWYPEQWMSMAGETLVDNSNGRDARATAATVDNETFVGLFEFIARMGDGLALNVGRNPSGADHLLAIAAGDAAFTIGSSAALGSIYDTLASNEDLARNVDIGIGPMPGPAGGTGATSAGGAALWTVANGASPEEIAASWAFQTWLTEPEQVARWHVGTGYIPIRESAAEDADVQALWDERPGFKVAFDQLAGEAEPVGGGGPVIGAYVEFRDAIEEGVESVLLEGADPAEVAARIQREADEAIESYNSRVEG